MPYVEISDSIHETYNGNERLLTSAPNIQTLLTPMQPVRCYVLDKIDMGKRHLTLSLRGSLVNRGMGEAESVVVVSPFAFNNKRSLL